MPIAEVQLSVRTSSEHGRVRRGFIGVGLQPVALPERQHATRRRGLLVVGIESGSPADVAGLFVGDVIVGAAGEATPNAEELQRWLTGDRVGTCWRSRSSAAELKAVNITVGDRAVRATLLPSPHAPRRDSRCVRAAP